eukprot:Lankesteria_metandrocarpae@DN1358_c0_g1_i1.p1
MITSTAMIKTICCLFQLLILGSWLQQYVDAQECYLTFDQTPCVDGVIHGEATFGLEIINFRLKENHDISYPMLINTQRLRDVGVSKVDAKAYCNIREINEYYPFSDDIKYFGASLSCENDVLCYFAIKSDPQHTFPVLRKPVKVPVKVPLASRSVRRASVSNNHEVGEKLLEERLSYFHEINHIAQILRSNAGKE